MIRMLYAIATYSRVVCVEDGEIPARGAIRHQTGTCRNLMQHPDWARKTNTWLGSRLAPTGTILLHRFRKVIKDLNRNPDGAPFRHRRTAIGQKASAHPHQRTCYTSLGTSSPSIRRSTMQRLVTGDRV